MLGICGIETCGFDGTGTHRRDPYKAFTPTATDNVETKDASPIMNYYAKILTVFPEGPPPAAYTWLRWGILHENKYRGYPQAPAGPLTHSSALSLTRPDSHSLTGRTCQRRAYRPAARSSRPTATAHARRRFAWWPSSCSQVAPRAPWQPSHAPAELQIDSR